MTLVDVTWHAARGSWPCGVGTPLRVRYLSRESEGRLQVCFTSSFSVCLSASSLLQASSLPMKLFSIQILRRGADSEPTTLAACYDVSCFGYFQRTAAREMINFVTKTVVERASLGPRLSIEHEGYFCHVHIRRDGLVGAAVVDDEYKARSAFAILNRLLDAYNADTRGSWRSATTIAPWSPLNTAIIEYQDPARADKVAAIEKELDETLAVLAQTLENVLLREEKLDDLVAKSRDLSAQSKVFYRETRRTNSCCIMM